MARTIENLTIEITAVAPKRWPRITRRLFRELTLYYMRRRRRMGKHRGSRRLARRLHKQ